jgi:tRNA pseudouridine13 synthase
MMIAAVEQDKNLGMEFYITDAPGCTGRLRFIAEDFQVEEVYPNLHYEGGRYLVLEVEKKDWDTHHLIRELARQLRISQRRFSWAGTKDKRAVTKQRISIMNLQESDLNRITLPDIKIRILGQTNRNVGLGDLLGNRFSIKIREMNCPDPEQRMERITEEIQESRGVPNYFGVQRFGDTRPITHKVGQALVHGKVEDAIFIYLAMPFPGEPDATRMVRQDLWDSRDILQAVKSYPSYLRYEMAILNYLLENPGDFAGSFNVLSPNLRHMFVHAYQSYIFNRILSRRMSKGLPLNRAIDEDIVCFARGDLPNVDKLQQVTSANLDAVNRLIDRRRAFVTLPLIGFDTSLASGIEGEIEKDILEKENVTGEDFRVAENSELGSRGSRRTALVRVAPSVKLEGDCATLEFFLPAGSYATVVLREYMKTGNLMEKQRPPTKSSHNGDCEEFE